MSERVDPLADFARVLIVDDSTDERRALAQILRQHGYQIDEAADGQSALVLLKGRACDLVLLDLQMPGVDGFEVLAFIQERRPELPVILLSGLPPDEIGVGIARLPSGELPPLLLKPVDTGRLLQVVQLKLAGELPG